MSSFAVVHAGSTKLDGRDALDLSCRLLPTSPPCLDHLILVTIILIMTLPSIFNRKSRKTSRVPPRIQRGIRKLLAKIRVRKNTAQVDMYQEALRLTMSREDLIEICTTRTVPMMDGEYDSYPTGGHSTIVHRPNQPSRPTFLTGDNAADSFTPSPPFGPIETSATISEVTSFHGSSMPLDLPSTAPTSLVSSEDRRLSGLPQAPFQQRSMLQKTSFK
jgi:hypothetical protein